jgi:PAS domain S-box-containing protein
MMRMKLFGKIFATVLTLVVITDTALLGNILREQTRKLSERILTENRVLANVAARDIETGFGSQEMPYEMLSDLLKNNDAVFWIVLRPDGTVYSSSDTRVWGRDIEQAIPPLAAAVGAAREQVISLPGFIDVLVEPMSMEDRGVPYVFCLAFSTAEVGQLQRHMIWQGVLVTAALIVTMGLVLYLYLCRVLTRPLRQMIGSTRAVAAGDWEHRIALRRADELGELARSFDKMTEDLRSTTVSKHYVDSVIQSIIDPLILVDQDGIIRSANHAACQTLQYSEPDLVGQPIETVGAGDILRRLLCQEHAAVPGESDEIHNVETTYLTRDGRRIPVLFSASVMRDVQDRIQCIVCTAKDITRRKQVEEQLRLATESAENANRSKSEFLANMSHEIRTPMTAILGFAELLLSPNMTAGARIEHIQTIRRNGEHLLTIINNILDLSKIEAGRMQIEAVACSPCQIVEEVLSLMRVRAAGKNLTLDADYRFPLPAEIRSDAVRLRQVLVNLIGNAIKFTPQGRIKIVVRCHLADPDNPVLCFDVMDCGIGMTPQQIEKLFQPFVQADSSTTRRFGGSGLGLTISQRLAQLLGGNIAVSSELGKGSCFSFTVGTGPLPDGRWISSLDQIVAAAPAHAPAKGDAPVIDGRVLLAEDGPDNRILIELYLRSAGADVTSVENGQLAVVAALEAVEQGRPFAVILMDMQMPVLDGYAATCTLREGGYKGAILALTAYAMASDRERCLQAGCDDYLTKPIDGPALIRCVAAHAGGRAVHPRREVA